MSNRLPAQTEENTRSEESAFSATPRLNIIVLILVLVLLYEVRLILLPFVIPAIISFMVMPVIDFAAQRAHLHRRVVAICLFILFMILLIGAGYFAVPTVVHQIERLAQDFQGQIERLVTTLTNNRFVSSLGYHIDAHAAAQHLIGLLRQELSRPGAVIRLVEWVFGGFFGLTLALLLLFYFMVGGRDLARKLLWMVPPAQRRTTLRIWTDLDPALRRYFIGVAATVVYASIVAYIGLGLILHVHHAVALALATGLLEMIPVIGPAAAIAIGGLASIHYASSFGAIIGYAIYATVLRLSIDQFFGPIILGRAARIPPPLVIFSFLAGGILFGVVGVILAVPAALTIRSILAITYEEGQTSKETRSSRFD